MSTDKIESRWIAVAAALDGPLSADTMDTVFVLRNGADGEEWRVVFRGIVQSPSWRERGPALAFLAGLQSGHRKPEPVR